MTCPTFCVKLSVLKQEQEGNELSLLHWGANQLRQQSCLKGYYFLYRMNGNSCFRKLLQPPAEVTKIQQGLL